jgi:fatty-acyl-CoA synthase
MTGYFRDPAATAAVLKDGWLWTGDLGFFSQGGLYITGRAKDLIIVRGRNYYAEDVERVAEHVEGVRPGGSIAFAVYDEEKATDLVVVVCETKVAHAEERARLVTQIGDHVARQCRLAVDEVVLVPPGTLPKTSSGKRQRALCRQLYLEDKLVAARTSRIKMARVFVRSGAGFLRMAYRRFLKNQREPE